MTVNEGMWLAVRAYGAETTVAHTAPVYVTTGGGFEKRSAVPELARRMINKLGEFDTVAADETQELESWSVGEPLTAMLAEQRVKILERADAGKSRLRADARPTIRFAPVMLARAPAKVPSP